MTPADWQRTAADAIAAATAEITEVNAAVADILEHIGPGKLPPESIYLHGVAATLSAVADLVAEKALAEESKGTADLRDEPAALTKE